MLTEPFIKCRLFSCFAAAAICLAATGPTLAGDCGCETSCDACPEVACDCNCDCSGSKKHNCLSKAFHAFTGGCKQWFGFGNDSGGCDAQCDDACDAAMINELMSPMPSVIHHHPHHDDSLSTPLHSVPIPSHEPSEMRMTEPRMQPLRRGDSSLESGARAVPPPVRAYDPQSELDHQPVPQPDTDSERESLFDTLSDPFSDDEAQTRTYRPVRPSSYDEPALRPIRKKPLSHSYSTSSRRATSVR